MSGAALSTLLSDEVAPVERTRSRDLPIVSQANLFLSRSVPVRPCHGSQRIRPPLTRCSACLLASPSPSAARTDAAAPVVRLSSMDLDGDDDDEPLPSLNRSKAPSLAAAGSTPAAPTAATKSPAATPRGSTTTSASTSKLAQSSNAVLADMDRLLTDIDWDGPSADLLSDRPLGGADGRPTTLASTSTAFSMLGTCPSTPHKHPPFFFVAVLIDGPYIC